MLYSCWRHSCHVCTYCTNFQVHWPRPEPPSSSGRAQQGALLLLMMNLVSCSFWPCWWADKKSLNAVVGALCSRKVHCWWGGMGAELEALGAKMPQKPWTACCQGWPCLLHLFTNFRVSGWIRGNKTVEIWWEKGEGFSLQLWTLIICIYATVNFQMACCSVIFQCRAPFGEFSWGTMKHIWICIPS